MKIRSIRPEFFTDHRMARLSPRARLLYIGLWCLADDEGRGRLLPKQIEGEVFPFEEIDFMALWHELETIHRVESYEVAGERFFVIPTFERYQKPNRKYESKLPAPPDFSAPSLFAVPDSSAYAARTHDGSTAPAHAVVVEGEGVVAVAAAAFEDFNMLRALEELKRRGKAVDNPSGYAKAIAADPVFVQESQRIWTHRDCEKCGGTGFYSVYSTGGGGKSIQCKEQP